MRIMPLFAAVVLCWMAVPAAHSQSTTQYLVALPQIAYGGGWETKIVITNVTATPQPVTLNYFDTNGNPLSVPFNGVGATQSTVNVPANGQVEVVPDFQGGTTFVGWAGIANPNTSLKIQAVFLWQNGPTAQTQAVAPLVSLSDQGCIIPLPVTNVLTMPYDSTGAPATPNSGYAFANTTSTAVTMTLKFYDQSGNNIGTDTEQIPAFGHTQFLVTDKVAALAGTKGTMQINGTGVVPLGFKFFGSVFTTWLP